MTNLRRLAFHESCRREEFQRAPRPGLPQFGCRAFFSAVWLSFCATSVKPHQRLRTLAVISAMKNAAAPLGTKASSFVFDERESAQWLRAFCARAQRLRGAHGLEP
jgi:hypothetical protein